MNEAERMIRVYRDRRRWDPALPGNAAILTERDGALRAVLGDASLAGRLVLDLGCGTGDSLITLHGCGADRVIGVDLIGERLSEAHDRAPGVALARMDGARLALAPATVDVVAAFTLMSSVAPRLTPAVAREVDRVLRPGGLVLWYDMRLPNLLNDDVHAVTRRRLRRLFPGYTRRLRTVTLLPPLARRAARWYRPMAALPPLRSHLAGVLLKP